MLNKNQFKLPYLGMEKIDGLDILYGLKGDLSATIQISNPVLRYSGNTADYMAYHSLLLNLLTIVGEGHVIQKHDVIYSTVYEKKSSKDFLQNCYQEHFDGRRHFVIESFLTIIKKGNMRSLYSQQSLKEFIALINKVRDLFRQAKIEPKILDRKEIDQLVKRMLCLDFSSSNIVLDNIKSSDTFIQLGERKARSVNMVDIDTVNLPESLSPFRIADKTEGLTGFPVDNLDFLFQVPHGETLVYHQAIEIPHQQSTLNRLEQKRKRHSGVPDAANLFCVEDIDRLLTDVARDNQMIVNSHYNILVTTRAEYIERASNYIESSLFQLGITPSRNAYNQMELFRCNLPGNAVELKKYDWFLTTAEAALCLWFKEAQPLNEKSDFKIRFTDRQGIPLEIDPSDLPMRTGRISNRNRFVLGGSGTGKSFMMSALLEQYCHYKTDIVIVDTGHSYSGLCSYFNGRYITYSEERPITMNPFSISREEFNLEKKDFLKTLIGLLWKGAEGVLTQIEDTVISNVLSAYYYEYFWEDRDKANPNRPEKLNFDSFYHFAIERIKSIKESEKIPFDLDEFRYVLRKFHTGGEFGTILNEETDKSLFTEPLIVFEIDNLKENRTLFPIIVLIITDVFIQKMRHRQDRRKVLVIEEAWKAIASPQMAGYIQYLEKTVRKFFGEIIVVTQELSDIIDNPIVKESIINNSDTIFLLDQAKFKDNYSEIAKLLSINEVEQRKIFSINQLDNRKGRGPFKEVYMRRGNVGEVYGVETSLAQYLTYTTEKPEKRAVETYVSRYGNYPKALQRFIADLKDSGKELNQFVDMVNQ